MCLHHLVNVPVRFVATLILASSLISAAYVPMLPRSEENSPCTGSSSTAGVCIATASCTSAGGIYISDACPNTPDDIKCCTKAQCGTDNKGTCRFTDDCDSGITQTDKSPWTDELQVCMPKGGGGGDDGYPTPELPSLSSGCKKTAIDGAKTIIDAFPGEVREIGCKRDCSGGDTSSQHCTGMATDLMVAVGGVKTDKGEPIAEWVMKHRETLSLRYVMWGQRIWEVSEDSGQAMG